MRHTDIVREGLFGIVGAILFFAILLGSIAIGNWITSYYTRVTKVVSYDGQVVTVEDRGGNLWQFYDYDGHYKRFDEVKLTMRTQYTENDITDDVIIKVNGQSLEEYVSGYTEKK